MGLAIAAAVAKGMARVMVKSRPNQGSTFIPTMPLLRAVARFEDDPPEPGGAAQGAAVRLE